MFRNVYVLGLLVVGIVKCCDLCYDWDVYCSRCLCFGVFYVEVFLFGLLLLVVFMFV